MQQTQVAIVGGGIVGLSQALAAARRGLSVTLFERNPKAQGASVRNFGTIWPIGLPAGELHDAAMQTRQMLIELASAAGFWLNPCGSIHLARADDEQAVLEEFLATSDIAVGYELLSPRQVHTRCPAARLDGLKCALWSPLEMGIDPRQTIVAITNHLRDRYNVRFEFSTTITHVESPFLRAADGRRWRFDQALICGGADFQTLFPDLFAKSGVRRCKLQMMRTAPQPASWRLGPHVAGGATLRHYSGFAHCPSTKKVRDRIAREHPQLDRFGIHILAAQNELGEIVIGDSHEYDDDIEPFDKPEIDAMILDHLSRMIDLPDPQITSRWHGIYPRHRSLAEFTANPQENVRIVLNTNGIGMTLSLALAEQRRANADSSIADVA